jgi:hypothetical protein
MIHKLETRVAIKLKAYNSNLGDKASKIDKILVIAKFRKRIMASCYAIILSVAD